MGVLGAFVAQGRKEPLGTARRSWVTQGAGERRRERAEEQRRTRTGSWERRTGTARGARAGLGRTAPIGFGRTRGRVRSGLGPGPMNSGFC